MKHILFFALFAAALFTGCEKADGPDESEETPIVKQEHLIVHFERRVSPSENWTKEHLIEDCPVGGINTDSNIFVTFTKDTVFQYIQPQVKTCTLYSTAHSDIRKDEITSKDLDELTFEFTYMELDANAFSEVWLRLFYGTIELELNLTEITENVQGVVRVEFEGHQPVVYDNGNRVNLNFGTSVDENRFSTGGNPDENFFETEVRSHGTTNPTLFKYSYLRLTSFGVE